MKLTSYLPSQYQFYKGSALQDLNDQWPFDFMGGVPSPAKLGGHRSCERRESQHPASAPCKVWWSYVFWRKKNLVFN